LVTKVAWRMGFDPPPDEWSASGRARFLLEVLPKGGIGAEVGVHKGHFTPVLIQVLEPEELHLVDPWYLLGLEWNWGAGDRSTINALTRILKRLDKQLADGSVVLHIGDDLEILPRFGKGYFDWIYIDSSHQYDHTCKELHLAAEVVKPDGIICGDDWRDDPSHVHYGVRKAVVEFSEASDFRIIYSSASDRQWAMRRT
jgi:hypothetical protein